MSEGPTPARHLTVSRAVAIGFGLGRLRPAPGTWGSAAAIGVGLAIYHAGQFWALAFATLAATLAGFWAVGHELRGRPGEDPAEFVIDEVAGQWLALSFPAFGFWWAVPDATMIAPAGWITAFLAFRLFDIRKPWVIGRADRRHDPAGVMIDDLLAGLFAGIATVILAALFHLAILPMLRP